jgi:DNA-binding IclR family transcriptional regulator
MSVMDVVAEQGPLSLTAVAGETELPKPTALRLLRALEEGGWVAHGDDGHYRIGARVLSLAFRYLDAESVLRIASPYMLRLREQVNETVSLVARSGQFRVCIQEFVSPEPLKVTHGVGSLAPLVDSPASGLLLLAHATPELRAEAAHIADPSRPYRQWYDDGSLEERCREIRERGWVTSVGGRGAGAAALAVSLHHPLTRETYALGVFAPESRFSASRATDGWIDVMQEAAAEIQGALQGETPVAAAAPVQVIDG